MITSRFAVVAAVLVLAGSVAACSDATDRSHDQAQSIANSVSGAVWVANEGADSLAVVDAAANTVVTTVVGIPKPHNVQLSRDGMVAYVLSANTNVVVAIDTATYRVSALAATGSAPAHVIEAPNGKIYVTNAADGTVSVYRAPGLTALGGIDLGGMPHGLRPAADGSIVVVANTMAGRLDLIDPKTDRVVGTVHVGNGPAQVAVTADGHYAYSGITQPPAVVKTDLIARKVVGVAPVPAPPVQVYLTPAQDQLLSADQGTVQRPGHTVSVIDTATMSTRGTVTVGSGPHGVVINTSGTRAWVTNTFDDTVSVIDLDTLLVQATVPGGNEPNGISFSPRPPAPAAAATTTVHLPSPGGQSSPHDHHH